MFKPGNTQLFAARAQLIGRTITEVGWLNPDDMYWHDDARALVIKLDNGSILYVTSDAEGNAPGCAVVVPNKSRDAILYLGGS
jgi:hypothetical protein